MRSALVAAVAAAVALAGCSDDLATVDKGKVQSCLVSRGANPREFLGTSAHAPREYGALTRENGSRGAIAVLGRSQQTRDGWAYVFFYNGSERAKTIYSGLTGGRDKLKVGRRTVPTTRRQNVIVLYGRRLAYGRTAGPADRQALEHCFDQAS